ncbi:MULTISPECIES: hypothetical protein [unclassified Leptolyngbya]|uniref:hypothetical protein n=1 Tax=unclassified Leptolyngbya TaxID=2650499 RepID=UPI001685B4E2|nr:MULTISPECIES: hypothetical protein [unclassified Leptolyngbya]MBD1910312.1 hypothetical protein [Leptolyngbya sp. FACHB-8]MBD2155776.1 hypothetical protein [Leptolyngbya sp. FACHB-16]
MVVAIAVFETDCQDEETGVKTVIGIFQKARESGMGCWSWKIGAVSLAIALMGWTGAASAQPRDDYWNQLLSNPPDMDMFALDYQSDDPNIVTSMNVSEVGLTIPSLWWAQQLYGGRLLENWAAFPAGDGLPRRVDLVVNEQVWDIYNYIERYTFVNRLGSEAEEYGYITRVFDRAGNPLSAYVCDFSDIASAEIQVNDRCQILLDFQGNNGMMGRSTPLASPSRGDGRFQQ